MASELVPVEQVDRDAANIAFDDVLSDAGSYAEYMRRFRREGGVRTLTEAFARHRIAAIEAQASRIAELEAGLRAISTFKCDDGDEAGAFYAVRLRARTLLGDREG